MDVRTTKRLESGLTLIEVALIILVIAVMGIVVLAPTLARRDAVAGHVNCVNNLKQIGIAFKVWSLDCGARYPMAVPGTNGGSKEWVSTGLAAPHFRVMSDELSSPIVLVCPEDPARHVATNFAMLSTSNLSYFVGVDASDENPQMFLSGDRNLTTNGVALRGGAFHTLRSNTVAGWTPQIHRTYGNILLDDGSVQRWTAAELRKGLERTGAETNRLAVP